MALENKTLLNDIGSAVVAETVSQLNRAACTTPPTLAISYGGGGAGAMGDPGVVNTDNGGAPFFHATEDCLVTSIKVMFIGAVLGTDGVPANTEFCLLRVPQDYDNGAGVHIDQLFPPTIGIHGDVVGQPLGNQGALGATYELLLATDGSPFTAANGFDDGQLGELLDFPAGGGAAALPAGCFNGTIICQNMAQTAAQSSPASVAMNAGDSLVWAVQNTSGATISVVFSVMYRPVKDALTLSPNYVQTMRNFSSTAR